MNAPSEDIKNLLLTAGLGLSFADNLHIGKQPMQPSDCVTLMDTGGEPTSDLCKFVIDEKILQIKVRGVDYTSTWNLAKSVADFLDNTTNYIVTGPPQVTYLILKVMNGPEHIDYDSKDRVQFIINLIIKRRL